MSGIDGVCSSQPQKRAVAGLPDKMTVEANEGGVKAATKYLVGLLRADCKAPALPPGTRITLQIGVGSANEDGSHGYFLNGVTIDGKGVDNQEVAKHIEATMGEHISFRGGATGARDFTVSLTLK